MIVALRDVGERGVEHLVRDLDPEPVGALHLQLLQDQPFEHLLAQHIARRRLLALLLDARADHLHLLLEIALQHDAVVDDGHQAVEQHAAAAQFLGRRRGSRKEGARYEQSLEKQ